MPACLLLPPGPPRPPPAPAAASLRQPPTLVPAPPIPPSPQALKLVTHIGRRGSPDLRRLMARASGAVRDLLHYRCDPDPFKGDTVWKRVQVGACCVHTWTVLRAVARPGEGGALASVALM